MTSAFSWQHYFILCFALFYNPRPNFLLLQVSLDFLLFIPVPYNEKDIFFGCQFQKVLQFFIEPFNFSFFSITNWGIVLDYRDIEWFALEMNRDHSVIFEVAQSCPTLSNPMDCSLPGSSIHGIFQARILEWVAISFSRGSSQARA